MREGKREHIDDKKKKKEKNQETENNVNEILG